MRQLQQSASDRVTKQGLRAARPHAERVDPAGRVTKLEEGGFASAGAPAGWSVERLLSVKLLLAVGCAVLALLLVDVTFVGVLLVCPQWRRAVSSLPMCCSSDAVRRPQQGRSVENSPTSSIR